MLHITAFIVTYPILSYSDGFSSLPSDVPRVGVFDSVLSRVGELCIYVVVLLATPMIMTHLALENAGNSFSYCYM